MYSETEVPEEVAELKETEEVAPVSESNGEDSEPKQEQEQQDSGSGQTFSYDQLKAKSDNPATGIDLKRREVGSLVNVFILVHTRNWY